MLRFRGGWQILATLFVLLAGVAKLAAGDAETRVFKAWVDDKTAGTYNMSISGDKDGVVTMRGQADIKVSYLGGLYSYKYTYSGEETWKDGRLQHFSSKCNDDGKEFTVSASADGKGLRLTVNGKESKASSESWLTSYWKLPDPILRKGALALIDADTGKPMAARLHVVGNEKLTIAGRELSCTHYRLTGGKQAELWYDAQERLVREEWLEDGHKTVLELSRIGK